MSMAVSSSNNRLSMALSGGLKTKVKLSDFLSKTPVERIQFYTNWLQEMAYKLTDSTQSDHASLEEAHNQLQQINDYCLEKFGDLEKMEQFSQMLAGNLLTQNRKYYTMDNLGFPEPQNINEYKLYQQWKKSHESTAKKVKKAWNKKNLADILSNSSGIKNLIKKYGISASFRPRVWMEISGAQQKLNESTFF